MVKAAASCHAERFGQLHSSRHTSVHKESLAACARTLIASPTEVNVCLSNFFTGFTLIGRVGNWNPLTRQGNPILSTDICQYRKGYKMQAWRSGYLEGSAVEQQQDLPAGRPFGHQHEQQLQQSAEAAPGEEHTSGTAHVGTPIRGNDIGKMLDTTG